MTPARIPPAGTTPQAAAEALPRPAGELAELAAYYDIHDTTAEMGDGHWVDPRPMKTTSLRLPADVVEALKARARRKGMRYTALLREILERAARGEQAGQDEELAQINRRLARIEAAITGQPTQAPQAGRVRHTGGEALPDDPYALGVGPDITDPEVMRQARC